ncbi:TRAP transporter large permease [Gracilibacillus timonensis]|uniref:TRAP transporter large permease n=1 Tax=Gracilibacillus timonensis TaxID=1816696 RepID=UPI000826FB88|nr:TRAP transporter large permease [Gracilibacillus timonensis]
MILAIILLGSFFLLIFLNVPIAVSLGAASLLGLIYSGVSFDILAPTVYSAITKYSLLAIPFFILAGLLMEKVGITRRLIYFAQTVLGGMRGGLAYTVIVVALVFAAISGSGPATVAALGTILIPAMLAQGYDRGMVGGLLSSTSSIGIIIPPSVAFIVYSSLASVSVSEIFLAGIIPGLLLGIAFIICSYFFIRKNDNIEVPRAYSAKEKFKAFTDAFWGLLAPVIILGGIYSGIFTPTEAAGVAVVYALIVGIFIYKELSFKKLFDVLVDSSVTTATVMYIVASATIFTWLLTTSLLAADMAAFITSISSNVILMLLLFNLIFLIAGFFLDTISAYYILTPVMFPVIAEMNIDPIHFGVFITINLAIGQFTPPVGVNLFVASNVGDIPLQEIVMKVIPYILVSIIVLLIVTFFPQLSLWLPSLMFE